MVHGLKCTQTYSYFSYTVILFLSSYSSFFIYELLGIDLSLCWSQYSAKFALRHLPFPLGDWIADSFFQYDFWQLWNCTRSMIMVLFPDEHPPIQINICIINKASVLVMVMLIAKINKPHISVAQPSKVYFWLTWKSELLVFGPSSYLKWIRGWLCLCFKILQNPGPHSHMHLASKMQKEQRRYINY